jgi:tRNA(Ile)-lysidine synthase
MDRFVRSLITEWRRLDLPATDETIVVAVSGGADSVSLLLGLLELRELGKLELRIVAAHFNHKLRDGESDADEEFVRQLTISRGVEFAVGHAKPLPTSNLEQNARAARYEFLTRTADNLKAHSILTGHTINDQAETFLMNLIRGSGPDGLCGMKAVRPIHHKAPKQPDGCETDTEGAEPLLFQTDPLLVRPLLSWAKRGDTEDYCRANGVEYRYDTMNEDTAFKRVRIRKILLPLLQDFNPNIIETLAKTAALMQKVPVAENCFADNDELLLSDLRSVDNDAVGDVIREWLGKKRGNMRGLELKHIDAIERLVFSAKSGNTAQVPGGSVVKSGGRLMYRDNKVEN